MGDKRAQFIGSNLELLGFGSARDALVQTVKELFENALDAVSSARGEPAMLRVRAQWSAVAGVVDVVCADTGTGFRAHQIRQLCCGVFETTKTGPSENGGAVSCGKYGLGLKAATLYSQLHVPGARLRIATTSDSAEILYIELGIDPDSEEPAVIQHVQRFSVDEDHRQFSGTEMRISVPAPESVDDVEHAADVLAVYFQSLRYTLLSSIGVEFALDIGTTAIELVWGHGQEPIDRFAEDFQASTTDLVYANMKSDAFSTNCMAALLTEGLAGCLFEKIEITVLRFANHVPMINAEDIFLCSLTKGILSNRVWKKLGYRCERNPTHLMNQLVATPTQSRRVSTSRPGPTARFVVAIDVSADVANGASIKYTNLKKSTLDKIYLKSAQQCCRSVLEQLHKRGLLVSSRQSRDDELLLEYVPLVAGAAASILNRSRQILATRVDDDDDDDDVDASMEAAHDADLLTVSLRQLLSQTLDHRSTSR